MVKNADALVSRKSQQRVLRVAAYAMVSCNKDMKPSRTDLVSHYRSCIQRNAGWQFCGVYSDEVFSWNRASHEGFQALMAACRAGELDMVITENISNMTRNTSSLLDTIRDLKEVGVDVYFEKEDVHSISERGERFLSLFVSLAQAESRNASMIMT